MSKRKSNDIRIEGVIALFLNVYPNPNTKGRYRTVMGQFCSAFAIRSLANLEVVPSESVARAQQFCASAESEATFNNRLACLRSFHGFLDATYGIRNPLNRATVRFRRVQSRSRTVSLSAPQLKKLLGTLKKASRDFNGHRDYLLMKVLALTSVRISEALQIRFSSIIKLGNIWHQSVLQKGGRERPVVIQNSLYKEIAWFCKKYHVDIVLCKADGSPISREHAFRIVRKRIHQVLGIPDASPHSLRKTFIELAQSRNVNPVEIMNSTGHAHMDMIAYYDNRSPLKHNASSALTDLTR